MAAGWVGISERKLVSDDAELHPWKFQCPKPYCYYSVCAYSPEDAAQKELFHDRSRRCPSIGKLHIGGSVTLTLVEQMWAGMDAAYDQFKKYQAEGMPADEIKAQGSKIRGMAEMTVIFMTPHFTTSDQIVKEVLTRWEKKKAGEPYETKGLAGRRFEPPVGTRHVEIDGKTHAVRTIHPKPMPDKLSDKEKDAIKFAMESGAFTATEVARTYKITIADVEKVISG